MIGAIVWTGPGELSGTVRVAGLTLRERAARTARAAGANRVLIVDTGHSRRHTHSGEPGWVTADEAAACVGAEPEVTRWLIHPASVVTDLKCLRALVQASGAVPRSVTPTRTGSHPGSPGVWLVDTSGACDLLQRNSLPSLTDNNAGVEQLRAEGVCVSVTSPEDLREAERLLLASQQSDTDGWVDRVFNRTISRAFSRLAVRTPITPDQVTWLHITMGLAGCALFATGNYSWGVLGALLLQLSVALDCADGEIARLKLQFSRWGGTLDVVGDNVVHAGIFIAIALAARRQLGVALATLLGMSAAAGIGMAFIVVALLTLWQQRRWSAGKPAGLALAPVAANHGLSGVDAAPAAPARLDAIINQLTSRDFTVLVVVAALAGHLEWMLWLAAVGAHVFWIAFLLLQLYFFRLARPGAAS